MLAALATLAALHAAALPAVAAADLGTLAPGLLAQVVGGLVGGYVGAAKAVTDKIDRRMDRRISKHARECARRDEP